jgi:hypothetical protein
MRATCLPTHHRPVNEKPFKIGLNLQKNVQIHPLSWEKTHIFEGRPALTEIHAKNLIMCMTALPDDPRDPIRGKTYAAYLGGLNFLAVNAITWRCELWAFGQFLLAFKGLMEEANYLLSNESASVATGRYLDATYPSLDRPAHKAFVELVDAFEARRNTPVELGDVYLMKLLCETIFRDLIIPKIRGEGGPEAAQNI